MTTEANEFDEQVFKAIDKYGATRLKSIVANVSDPYNGLAFLEAARRDKGIPFSRTVDRSLQRLRKQGRIAYGQGRWSSRKS